ncbi:MAG: PfkB family carbohydrate kinase, partial [Planctomycetota bacterium]
LDCPGPILCDASHRERLIRVAELVCPGGRADAAIITDFGLGLMTPRTITALCEVLRPRVGFLSGDVSGKRSSLLAFNGLDWLCPSEQEMREALVDHDSSLPAVAWEILRKTGSRRLCATLGADGLVAFDRIDDRRRTDDAEFRRTVSGEPIPSLSPVPVDTLGCGDTLLAASTLALATGASHAEAAYIGNAAASIQAGLLGNHPVGGAELLDTLRRLSRTGVVVRRTGPAREGTGVPRAIGC